MVQEVTLNGRPLDLDYHPSLEIGASPLRRTPIEINGKMVHGININGYDYPPAESGSVLYFPGLPAQGSTIWDRSNQGNHGTITGAIWKRLASGLWYLSFDGDDYVDCGTDSSLDLTAALTEQAWVKVTTDQAGQIASKDILGSRAYTFQWVAAASGFRFYVNGGAGNDTALTGAASLDTWYHVVATYTSSLIAIYLNGVLKDSRNPDAASINVSTAKLYIGRRAYVGAEDYLIGSIALVRVHSRTLTAAEIAGIYNRERHLFGV